MDKKVDEKKSDKLIFDSENLAIPEIHIADKVVCDNDTEDETEEKEIDFSGAIPEIHLHKKSK